MAATPTAARIDRDGPDGGMTRTVSGAKVSGVTLAEDRDAIRDLYARYCHDIDSGAAASWADAFTDDATFDAGFGEPLVGRDALLAFASGLAPGSVHHMVLNEAIDVDGDTATCRSSVLVISGGAVVAAGRSDDVLRRVDGRWRIAERVFAPA